MLRKKEKQFLDAARTGDIDLLKRSIDDGVNVDLFDPAHHHRALMFATTNKQLPAINLLLQAGADIDAMNSYKRSALSYAIIMGHEDIAFHLISLGADIRKNDKYNNSMLMFCSHNGLCRLGKYLIDQGLPLDQINTKGQTLETMAKDAGQDKFLHLIDTARQNRSDNIKKAFGSKGLALRRRR